MKSILERLKEKKIKIAAQKDKLIFIKVENNSDLTFYHTKIMMDLYRFGVNKKQNHKFFISFRGLFNQEKIESFHLFAVRDDDKFLGIFYGFRKPIKNVVRRYEENGVMKASTFSKVYYIEFRFKKGSVFCYLEGLAYFFKERKFGTKYCKSLIIKLSILEDRVYKFYDKKLPNGGFISKWIKRNQK
ncbi:DUF226 domain-containing protein [Borrelia duttonii]|uniref:Plasmid partitioning associated protein-1 n=1 Tax=Borrelia duttonii (strain Ly) TaxID=412419 RepID=B5RN61_BORDL|nr:plasmid partitioning associated protein-1 [Borrelia duttonii Ly]